jgi:(heptosyl)LPS beta-1,4-glucosyltransferase
MIEACLESLDWVDEIVILDSGSADRTLELARKRGAKVHVREDWQGYGIQRQRAQQLATGDYILAIDADERVSPELRKSIQAVLANPDDQKVYEVVRNNRFLGATLDLHGWHHETLIRLYSRKHYTYHDSHVHESVDTRGAAVKQLRGPLYHDTCHDYEHFLQKHVAYAHTWARERAEQGRKSSLTTAVMHASWNFFRLYLLQGGFLDGRRGFLFALHASHYVFNKYAALWYYGRAQGATRSEPFPATSRHAA